MSATVEAMGKKKASGGKHLTPRRLVGIPDRLATALQRLGDERMQNLTEVVKAACIKYLAELGRWPPTPPPDRKPG